MEAFNVYNLEFRMAQKQKMIFLILKNKDKAMGCVPLCFFVLAAHLCIIGLVVVEGLTDPETSASLRALQAEWKNSPPSWKGNDPCGSDWEGVICTNSKVTSLSLSTMNLQGTLTSDIGSLVDLRSLDLSYNKGLEGPIPYTIGKLTHLDTLIMIGCSFSGSIPKELGNLRNLTFLALNSNKLGGVIPPELGYLNQLYWFDIADNQITGKLPVSTPTSPGLDMLLKAKHFHFSKNKLMGPIPSRIFNENMQLIHVLFDNNNLIGEIPETLSLVTTLEVLRLDRNSLSGPVPILNNLTKVGELHLSNNRLNGPIPDLSTMTGLSYLDMSNNSFSPSDVPEWMTKMESLTTILMESTNLGGDVPSDLFSLPELQTINFRKNDLNGSLSMGAAVGPQLLLVNLEFNKISDAELGKSYNKTLLLLGNPACDQGSYLSNSKVCRPPAIELSYSTPSDCPMKSCRYEDEKTNPKTCQCQVPYSGQLVFRSPSFSALIDDPESESRFGKLEASMWRNLSLPQGFVFICCLRFDENNYLTVQLQLFPPRGKYFARKQVQNLGSALSKQTYKPPHLFGPYYFIADIYSFPNVGKATLSSSLVIGIATGVALLTLTILAVSFYAVRQKRRAERALELSKPFMSWGTGTSGADSGGAPKLKGARWFSLQELKKATNNFSEANEIGSGGYGKVYKGIVPGEVDMVAIKRAKEGSLQGGAEFKTEIELLSRVHHKNLVSLIGFCFEQGEQLLVYEYMSNGTLRESLSGKTGIHLDWKRRVKITLGSARGLTYLHELANPPIIHRDVKSANILLDENLTAKVADFGLSKLIPDGGTHEESSEKVRGHFSSQVKGTMGYLDPEYYMTHQLSEKSDVYSFGVVLLEVVTGRQPIERGKYIVREVRSAMEVGSGVSGMNELVDPLLLPVARDASTVPGLEAFVSLALRCVEEGSSGRPRMSTVVKELELIASSLDGVVATASPILLKNNNGNMKSNTNYCSSSSLASASSSLEGYHYNSQSLPFTIGNYPYNVTHNVGASSSEEGEAGGVVTLQRKHRGDSFDYSGGFTVSTIVEPK